MDQVSVRRSTRARRWVAVLAATAILAALLPLPTTAVLAAEDPAGASAAGFLYYKYPSPDPLCEGIGLNVSSGPYFTPEECGFAVGFEPDERGGLRA